MSTFTPEGLERLKLFKDIMTLSMKENGDTFEYGAASGLSVSSVAFSDDTGSYTLSEHPDTGVITEEQIVCIDPGVLAEAHATGDYSKITGVAMLPADFDPNAAVHTSKLSPGSIIATHLDPNPAPEWTTQGPMEVGSFVASAPAADPAPAPAATPVAPASEIVVESVQAATPVTEASAAAPTAS